MCVLELVQDELGVGKRDLVERRKSVAIQQPSVEWEKSPKQPVGQQVECQYRFTARMSRSYLVGVIVRSISVR